VTNFRLRFHASIDINIGWGDVAGIEGFDKDVVVSIGARRRQYRFCFPTAAEANRGALIARTMWSAPADAV